MIKKYFSLILISLFSIFSPLRNSFAAKTKKKTLNKNETKNKKSPEISESKKLMNMKNNMSVSQFKQILEYWQEGQMLNRKPVQTEPSTHTKPSTHINKNLDNQFHELERIHSTENNEINALKEKIKALQNRLEELKNMNPKNRKDKKKVNGEIEKLKAELNTLNEELKNKLQSSQVNSEKLHDLKNQMGKSRIASKIAEAELLLIEAINTKDLTDQEKQKINNLRSELKNIVDTYKNTNHLDYARLSKLILDYDELLKQYNKNKKDIVDYRERIDTLKNLLRILEEAYKTKGFLEKNELKNAIQTIKQDINVWDNIDNNNIKEVIHKGLVFKVQIGAYKNRDLKKLGEQTDEDLLEQEDKDGLHQYTLRTFRNYYKADKFKKEMRAIMGFEENIDSKKLKGAPLVIAYLDGKRISLNQVQDTIKKQKNS